jgi:RNA polymerase primary sigma factor
MRKAMVKNEAVRTVEEIADEERQRERMAVIREFVESKTANPVKAERN